MRGREERQGGRGHRRPGQPSHKPCSSIPYARTPLSLEEHPNTPTHAPLGSPRADRHEGAEDEVGLPATQCHPVRSTPERPCFNSPRIHKLEGAVDEVAQVVVQLRVVLGRKVVPLEGCSSGQIGSTACMSGMVVGQLCSVLRSKVVPPEGCSVRLCVVGWMDVCSEECRISRDCAQTTATTAWAAAPPSP